MTQPYIPLICLSILIPTITFSRELPNRPVATYSIVALDPDTKELGVAVQSHWFSVGSLVPWTAVTLASSGQLEEALPIFQSVFKKEKRWRQLIPRLVKSQLLPDDTQMIRTILEQ